MALYPSIRIFPQMKDPVIYFRLPTVDKAELIKSKKRLTNIDA